MHLDDRLFSDKKLYLPLLAAVLVLPWLPMGTAGPYVIRIATLTLLYMVLAQGLNVVPGFTGLLDLGYVGFFGIGAYTAGLLTVHYQWSLWLVLPLAVLNGALWGVLRGAPTLRLSDDYFAIVTFGFSELIILVLKNELWLTRGPMGVPGIARPDLSAGYWISPGRPTILFYSFCCWCCGWLLEFAAHVWAGPGLLFVRMKSRPSVSALMWPVTKLLLLP